MPDGPLLPRSFWPDPAQREHDLYAARYRLDLQEKAWNVMVRRWPGGTAFGSVPPPAPTWQPPGLSDQTREINPAIKEG